VGVEAGFKAEKTVGRLMAGRKSTIEGRVTRNPIQEREGGCELSGADGGQSRG
jgi:hypothetical protein